MTTLGKDKEPVPPAHSPSTAIRRRRGQGVTRSEEECRSIWGLNERFMIPQYVAASGVITGLVTGRATRDPEINGEVTVEFWLAWCSKVGEGKGRRLSGIRTAIVVCHREFQLRTRDRILSQQAVWRSRSRARVTAVASTFADCHPLWQCSRALKAVHGRRVIEY